MTIFAGLVSEGTSNLKYHALRPDETAACSSSLPVRREGPASSIDNDLRCRARACHKLFRQADLDPTSGGESEYLPATATKLTGATVAQAGGEIQLLESAGVSDCQSGGDALDGIHDQKGAFISHELTAGSESAELEALRRDAGLYRWLRERGWYIDSAANALGLIPARRAWAVTPPRPDWDEVEDALVALINGENDHVSEYE